MATNNLLAKRPTNQLAAGIRIRTESSTIRVPLNLRTVDAGDLITARYINDLVGAVLTLEQRVVELEGRIGALKINKVDVGYGDFAFIFDVTGTGLEPDNLKRFAINEEQIKPEHLEGDDSHIRFTLRSIGRIAISQPPAGSTPAQLVALNERAKDRINGLIESLGGSLDFVLTIENDAGAIASRDFTISSLA
jgi:hypothetical protein